MLGSFDRFFRAHVRDPGVEGELSFSNTRMKEHESCPIMIFVKAWYDYGLVNRVLEQMGVNVTKW